MRLRSLSCLLAVLLLVPTVVAQVTLDFQPRADLNDRLPESIRVFQADGTQLRNGQTLPVRAFLVRADTSDKTWELRALLSEDDDGIQTTSAFALDSDAFLAINAGYFGGGQSYSLVAEDGQVKSPNIGSLGGRPAGTYYPTRGAFALLDDGAFDVAWIYNVGGTTYAYPNPSPNTQQAAQPTPTATFPEGGTVWPLGTGVGGGPVLVENGQRRITWEQEVFFGSGIGDVNALQPRTAIGYTESGELLLLVVDGRQSASVGISLVDLADLFIALGAQEALNLDGGGSSTMVAANTLVNRPEGGTSQRQVASALVLARPEDLVVNPDAGLIFDTGDAGYSDEGEWFESANTPFWGETKARLNAAGTGADRAVFRFGTLAAGDYDLSAWNVPSFNRATNTPFTVYQSGQPTTVRFNQADVTTQNKWNELGRFTLAPGDSVVVTDDAQGTTSPAYVVVDAVRLVPVTVSAAAPDGSPDATLTVAPSPARDRVTITTSAGEAQQGQVYDLTGRLVGSFEVSAAQPTHSLDVRGWSAGVYAVRLVSASRVQTRLFVVAR